MIVLWPGLGSCLKQAFAKKVPQVRENGFHLVAVTRVSHSAYQLIIRPERFDLACHGWQVNACGLIFLCNKIGADHKLQRLKRVWCRFRQRRVSADACQDVENVNTDLGNRRKIGGVGLAFARFIIVLSVFFDAADFTNLRLGKPEALALKANSFT